ncbi:MAG: LEA type 2 family protein [Alcanivorax sediminis]|uniref:LEA type 2 family protein n=1 Tax=Alcanivorax sediminis TaxID=2663008 RepID=UPI003C67C378
MKTLISAWLFVTALFLSGCQTLGSLESPEVSLAGINLNKVSLFEQEWGLTLRARNPNDRDLTLKSMDYEIYVNGEKFGRGLTAETVTLPAMGDATVRTTITTSLLESLQKLQEIQQNPGEPFTYRLVGKAKVAGVPIPLSFDREGQMKLPAMP